MNFKKYWAQVQNNDWGVDGALTDIKGGRSLSPSKQTDPDLFLYVAEHTAAVGYLPESMHGAGSPQAQRIMIARQSNLERKKQLAKDIARI